MRNRAATRQSYNMNLNTVRDNRGPAIISITSIYVHTEDDARHDQSPGGHRLGWSDRCSIGARNKRLDLNA